MEPETWRVNHHFQDRIRTENEGAKIKLMEVMHDAMLRHDESTIPQLERGVPACRVSCYPAQHGDVDTHPPIF